MSWSCPRCDSGRDYCECTEDTSLLEEIRDLLLEVVKLLKQQPQPPEALGSNAPESKASDSEKDL